MIRVGLISFLSNSINIRLLSSYLKESGFEVFCLFYPEELNETAMRLTIELLHKYAISLVGVSLVTDDCYKAIELTVAIKQKLSIPVIWGGAHPSVLPEECLHYADMVCIGEGEEAILELCKSYNAGNGVDTTIKNIWFNHNGKVLKNELRFLEENLDKFPFPDLDFSTQWIFDKHGCAPADEASLGTEYSLMTSRGCPYSCSYCYNNYRKKSYAGKGEYLRARSIHNVIDELIQAKKRFKSIERINFWDDSFIARSINDFKVFKDLYLHEIGIPFYALAEPMAFDYEKIGILKDCMLEGLQVGIQSGSERTNREDYNRPVANAKILEIANFIHMLGIKVRYDVIFNNPYESKEDIRQTISLFLQFPRPFLLQGYNIIFFPGTSITDKALKDGLIAKKSYLDYYSKIQGSGNSPLETDDVGVVSSRFYDINYDLKANEYLILVFLLLRFNHIPKKMVEYFKNHENNLNKILLRWIIKVYMSLVIIKNSPLSNARNGCR